MVSVPDFSQEASGFILLMPGFNAAPYVSQALKAIAGQSVKPKALIVIDDASTDETNQLTNRVAADLGLSNILMLARPSKNQGKAQNIYEVLKRCKFAAEDVIVMHDLDDYLASEKSLEALQSAYTEGWDVVYSNHTRTSRMGRKSFCEQIDPFLTIRKQAWRTSHLFTFKARLIEALRAEHFQDQNGDWLKRTSDMALAFAVTDQTPYVRYLDEILLVYRDDLGSNDHATDEGAKEQRILADWLRAQPSVGRKEFNNSKIGMGDLMKLKSEADHLARLRLERQINGLKAAMLSKQRS